MRPGHHQRANVAARHGRSVWAARVTADFDVEARTPKLRPALVLVLVVAALVAAPQSAQAHSELLSSQPAPGQRLGTAPGAVVLEFSEALDPKLSYVTVT